MPTFVNFSTNLPNCTRLKVEHIIKEKIEGYKKDGTPIKKIVVNWDFWENLKKKSKGFDIVLDEVHNVLHSRRSMSQWNTLASMWLTQIRKILGSSELHHLYLISQRPEAVDITARELAGEIIDCQKEEIGNNVYILKTIYMGRYCLDKYFQSLNGVKSYDYRSYFRANEFFNYYDSYEIVRFGDEVYL